MNQKPQRVDAVAQVHRQVAGLLHRPCPTGARSLRPGAVCGFHAREHQHVDDAVVKLLWLAIINIDDKRARERATRAGRDGVRNGYPGRLIESQKTFGWRKAFNELAAAYPGRIR